MCGVWCFAVQRLFKRLPQELLVAQLGVAMCAMRPSGPAQKARIGEPNWTSRLFTSRGHDDVAAPLLPFTYLLSVCVHQCFSTRVPWNLRVLPVASKGSTELNWEMGTTVKLLIEARSQIVAGSLIQAGVQVRCFNRSRVSNISWV